MNEQRHQSRPADRNEDIGVLEDQLSLLWRQSRSNAHQIARRVHPDIEPGAYGLLATLQRRGQMRLTELATEIGVGKPSLSRQISMLEKLGVVAKTADPSDGRAQAISLTPTGLEKLSAAQGARREIFHGILEEWDDSELGDLGRLLTKLNASYRGHRDQQA